jgi:hypothetical protein
METNKDHTPLNWLLLELSKKGFFYVTKDSFPEFKNIVKEAQKLELKETIKSGEKEIVLMPFCLN